MQDFALAGANEWQSLIMTLIKGKYNLTMVPQKKPR